jgi:hypothetical protein
LRHRGAAGCSRHRPLPLRDDAHDGWPIVCAIDFAAAYYTAEDDAARGSGALPFALLLGSPPTRSASSSSRRVIPFSPLTPAA